MSVVWYSSIDLLN